MFCELGNEQVEEIKKMKIGDPLDRSTDHGPQNHKAHLEKLLQYCEAGVKEGATLVYGGRQVPRPGKTTSGVLGWPNSPCGFFHKIKDTLSFSPITLLIRVFSIRWLSPAIGFQWVEARDAAKPLPVHKTAPQQRIIWPKCQQY